MSGKRKRKGKSGKAGGCPPPPGGGSQPALRLPCGKALLLTASYQVFSLFLGASLAHGSPQLPGGRSGGDGPSVPHLSVPAGAAGGAPPVQIACVGCTTGPDNVPGCCVSNTGGSCSCTGCTYCTRCTECTRCTGCTGCTGCVSLTTPREVAVHHYYLAEGHRSRGDWAAAEAEYREAIRVNPGEWSDLHFLLAYVVDQLGRHEEAISEYRETIRIHPAYASAYNNIGVICENLGRSAEAEEWYRKALEVDPEVPNTPRNLERTVRDVRNEERKAAFEKAYAADESGKQREAERRYRDYLRVNPDSDAAWNNLGSALESQGDRLPAEAAFRKAASLSPEDEMYRKNLARVVADPVRNKALAEALAANEQGGRAKELADAFKLEAAKGQSMVCFDDARGCSFTDDHATEAIVFAPKEEKREAPVPDAVKSHPDYLRLSKEKEKADKEYRDRYQSLEKLWKKRDGADAKEKGSVEIKIAEVRNRLTVLKSEQRVTEIRIGKVYRDLGFKEP